MTLLRKVDEDSRAREEDSKVIAQSLNMHLAFILYEGCNCLIDIAGSPKLPKVHK